VLRWMVCVWLGTSGGRADGAEEAFHASGDGPGAAGTQPVQGASDGAAGGCEMGRDAESCPRTPGTTDQETLVRLELVRTDKVFAVSYSLNVI